MNEEKALVELYVDVVDEFIENLQFHPNSDIDPLLEKHGPVEEEPGENEMKEDDVTLRGDEIVNANVVNLTQSVSNIENDDIINAKIRNLNIKTSIIKNLPENTFFLYIFN